MPQQLNSLQWILIYLIVSLTKDEEELKSILGDALKDSAVVVTTLVSDNLTQIVEDFAERTGLQYINLMSQFMDIVHQKPVLLHYNKPVSFIN